MPMTALHNLMADTLQVKGLSTFVNFPPEGVRGKYSLYVSVAFLDAQGLSPLKSPDLTGLL